MSDDDAQLDERDRADMIRLAAGHDATLNDLMCVFRRISDTDSDFDRTGFRKISDSIPILAGRCSDGYRTAFRKISDRVPILIGQHSEEGRTVFSAP